MQGHYMLFYFISFHLYLFYLLYFILSIEECVDGEVATTSKEAQKILRPIVNGFIEAACAEATQSKKKSRKIGRNEPCPCGSGKKIKKCCGR